MSVDYFAYGSNMSAPRIAARVARARQHAVGFIRGHRLCFHKVGRDGSGKCDALDTGDDRDRVYGVVYRLVDTDLVVLDRFEDIDVGYRRNLVDVELITGGLLRAHTYLAIRTDSGLQPYDWYLAHVLDGARAAGLPEEYIRMIAAVPSRPADT